MTNTGQTAIIVPSSGLIEHACEASLQALEKRGYTVWRVFGYSAIDQARNDLATRALDEGFDATIWIDSDIGFHPDDVEKIRANDLPMVCALYPKKGLRSMASHVLPNTDKIVFGQKGGLTEIMYAATGFLAVKRHVYETIQRELKLPTCNAKFGKAVVPFFQPMIVQSDGDNWYLGEDFAFSERARQCGFKVMADTRIRLEHYGSYGFSWEDAGSDPLRYSTYTYNLT